MLMSHGFVLGTGDLSELALGWCTYNGDHMSMYNVNCSIPKTLVKFLVDYAADHEFYQDGYHDKEAGIYLILKDIVGTTISPELLPVNNNEIQSTENTLGPYELHDFFLFNFIRHGFSPEKILFLATNAKFSQEYPDDLVKNTLKTFYTRFFKNQFKRSCVPDGPKVGSVSLSPRGDFRMPSDADVKLWLENL
jgi:NAD+ synthase (glutamine-hydrolysing)